MTRVARAAGHGGGANGVSKTNGDERLGRTFVDLGNHLAELVASDRFAQLFEEDLELFCGDAAIAVGVKLV